MAGEPGPVPGSVGGLELRPNVLRGFRTAATIPGLSLTKAVLILAACFVLSAVLFPTLLRLPRWIEFEIVVVAWWVVWAVALTYLLYTGRGLIDDFRVERLPRFRRRRTSVPGPQTSSPVGEASTAPAVTPMGPGATVDELRAAAAGGAAVSSATPGSALTDARLTAEERRETDEPTAPEMLVDVVGRSLASVDPSDLSIPRVDLSGVHIPEIHPPALSLPPIELPDFKLPDLGGDGGGDDAGSIIVAILIGIVAVIVVGLIVFVTVQFVIPALAIGTYALIRGQIQRVRVEAGALAGDLRRSLLRGVAWATVYTAPFALVVWLGHLLL